MNSLQRKGPTAFAVSPSRTVVSIPTEGKALVGAGIALTLLGLVVYAATGK